MVQKNLAGTIKFNDRKRLFILLLFLQLSVTIQAQQLTGLWYSSDSTRKYEIKKTADNKLEAVIQSSARKNDSVGYTVIKKLAYNTRKKRYEGIIYSVADSQPVFVKIKFDKDNPNRIILKLSRMFVLDVAINWIRVSG